MKIKTGKAAKQYINQIRRCLHCITEYSNDHPFKLRIECTYFFGHSINPYVAQQVQKGFMGLREATYLVTTEILQDYGIQISPIHSTLPREV